MKSAKAYAALLGAVVTALLGTYSYPWLAAVAAVCTAVATYQVPNTEVGEDGSADTTLLLLVGCFIGIVLLLCGVRFN